MNASPEASWQNRNPHQQQQQHPSPDQHHHQKIARHPTTLATQANKQPSSSSSTDYWHQQHQQQQQQQYPTVHRQVSLGYSSSTGGSQASDAAGPGISSVQPQLAAASRSSASYLRMRAPSSQLYGPDSAALLAAGGHRMALKLASPGPAASSRGWPQQHQHQVMGPGSAYGGSMNGTSAAECRAPECCGGLADCSSDLVELLSDCSCSDSLDFQCPAAYQQHHQYSMHHQSPHHLSSRRPAAAAVDQLHHQHHQQQQHHHHHHRHQSLKLSSSETQGARYPAGGYSAGGGRSRSPTPPPPPPPLLVNQNTYTTTHETINDSSMMLVDSGLCQQAASSQLRHQRRSNSIETDPLLDELNQQHHKRAIVQTMSLGRANHHQPYHHPLAATEFMHKPLLQSKSPSKRQQHSVSFRRSAPNPAEPGSQLASQQQQQQPLDKLSAVQHHPAQWTPNHIQQQHQHHHQQPQQQQHQSNSASRQQLDYSRQVNHSHKLAKDSAPANGVQKKPETRHRNNNNHQMEQPPAINQCTTGQGSPVSMGQLSPEARCGAPASGQQQQQQQASSIAIYPPGSPLGGPTSPAQDLHSHQPPLQAPIMSTTLAGGAGAGGGGGGRASTAHLLSSGSGGNLIEGQPVLQLQPVTTSHRNYAHWMRVSSIVLTPVGLIIILFIVVSPLLHYLM